MNVPPGRAGVGKVCPVPAPAGLRRCGEKPTGRRGPGVKVAVGRREGPHAAAARELGPSSVVRPAWASSQEVGWRRRPLAGTVSRCTDCSIPAARRRCPQAGAVALAPVLPTPTRRTEERPMSPTHGVILEAGRTGSEACAGGGARGPGAHRDGREARGRREKAVAGSRTWLGSGLASRAAAVKSPRVLSRCIMMGDRGLAPRGADRAPWRRGCGPRPPGLRGLLARRRPDRG